MNQNSEAASTHEWLSVSQAASALGISERTARRRCESGKLEARLVATESGQAWQIAAAAVNGAATGAAKTPEGAAIAADRVRPHFKSETGEGADTAANSGEGAANTAAIGAAIGAATFQSAPPLENPLEMLRDALERERDQNAFLRGLIEQRDRDAAELRAALREALRAMPKAITAGDMSTHAAAHDAPQARENSETGKAARPSANGQEGGKTGKSRPLWKVILGVR